LLGGFSGGGKRASLPVTVADQSALWLLERHGYRTPNEARDHLLTLATAVVRRSIWKGGGGFAKLQHELSIGE
jgi:hypothetical protein